MSETLARLMIGFARCKQPLKGLTGLRSAVKLTHAQESNCFLQYIVMGPEERSADAENGGPNEGRLRWGSEDQYDGPEASTPGSSEMDVRSGSPNTENGRIPLPVWLRESSKSFHWRWVPLPIRHAARAVVAWLKGPDPPQIQRITPFFPSIQEAPAKFIDTHFPKRSHKTGLLAFFYFCWLLTFSLVLNHSAQAGNIKGYGKPQPIWCGASFWLG